jgi:NADH-quinone oxidoreductase subunit N
MFSDAMDLCSRFYPEIVIAFCAVALLLLHRSINKLVSMHNLAIITYCVYIVLLTLRFCSPNSLDKHIVFGKIAISLMFVLYMILIKNSRIASDRLVLIQFCSTISLIFTLTSENLLGLLIGLEAYGFLISMMIVGDLKRFKLGMRYMMTSAFFTALAMYGTSLCFYESGSFCWTFAGYIGYLLEIGEILVLISILFKIACAPFHVWLSDVYKGTELTSALFLESVSKLGLAFVIVIFASKLSDSGGCIHRYVLCTCSILSMILGAVCAIRENNIRAFLAYSAIGQVGFALIPLCIRGAESSYLDCLMYVFFYCLASLCLWISLERLGIRKFGDFCKLSRDLIFERFTSVGALLSMLGIPPFAGFFVKIDVIKMLFERGEHAMIISVVLYSLLSVCYTSRLIKPLFSKGFPLPSGARFVHEHEALENNNSSRTCSIGADIASIQCNFKDQNSLVTSQISGSGSRVIDINSKLISMIIMSILLTGGAFIQNIKDVFR